MSTENPLEATRWDLSNIFPSLKSDEYEAGVTEFEQVMADLTSYVNEKLLALDEYGSTKELAKVLADLIDKFNVSYALLVTLRVYISSFVTTDSYNQEALKEMSRFEKNLAQYMVLRAKVTEWVGKLRGVLPELLEMNETIKTHQFFLEETVEVSQYLMSEKEEELAAQLRASGAGAWQKLQGTITSQLGVDFEIDGETKRYPMPALINLHGHPDEDVRKRAYFAEMKAWESVKEPLAACMNGVKGYVRTLEKRRGREDALHSALEDARIDRATLDAMMGAMTDSFPMFHKYFLAKAKRMGKEKLAWWDIFAPAGKSDKTFTFPEAREFVLKHFGKFSDHLRDLAKTAFDSNWIDAEQRDGKRGGAFCMGVPTHGESRILCNFDGSLDQVFTVAHELGHAYHNLCITEAGKEMLQRETPMTMAETASIMCETLMMDAALAEVSSPEEELAILETSLISDAQVIVDISSRFLFETEVFDRVEKAALSADELSELMEEAQKATFGPGVDENYLHKYMWTWKPHYYRPELNFYNFPYAFGQLFGIGLFAIYQERGEEFLEDYRNLLASTGEGTAAELAARFGIDITTKDFWEASLKVIGKRIDRYCEL